MAWCEFLAGQVGWVLTSRRRAQAKRPGYFLACSLCWDREGLWACAHVWREAGRRVNVAGVAGGLCTGWDWAGCVGICAARNVLKRAAELQRGAARWDVRSKLLKCGGGGRSRPLPEKARERHRATPPQQCAPRPALPPCPARPALPQQASMPQRAQRAQRSPRRLDLLAALAQPDEAHLGVLGQGRTRGGEGVHARKQHEALFAIGRARRRGQGPGECSSAPQRGCTTSSSLKEGSKKEQPLPARPHAPRRPQAARRLAAPAPAPP